MPNGSLLSTPLEILPRLRTYSTARELDTTHSVRSVVTAKTSAILQRRRIKIRILNW